MPRQRFTHTAVADVPVSEVWQALDRPETWEQIGGVESVTDPVIDDDGHLQGFAFYTAAGGTRYRGTATPHARVELETIGWNVETSEIRGVTLVSLTPEGSATRIEVTLEVESVGILASLFFPVVASSVGKGLPDAVERFAAELGRR